MSRNRFWSLVFGSNDLDTPQSQLMADRMTFDGENETPEQEYERPTIIPGTKIPSSGNLGYYKMPSLPNASLFSTSPSRRSSFALRRDGHRTPPDYSSSLFGPYLNADYLDKELFENMFSYGPVEPKQIRQGAVPRPEGYSRPRGSKTVYHTSRIVGFIPTFGHYTIVDTGSASPLYITPTFTQLPVYGGTVSDLKLPFGVLVQPFAENDDYEVPRVELLEYMADTPDSAKNLIRCKHCLAYYNPFMHTSSRTLNRVCNMCRSSFRLTQEEADALERLAEANPDGSPIAKGSVDFVAPPYYYSRERYSWSMPDLLTKASELTLFKQRPKEKLVYGTYSAAPVPLETFRTSKLYDVEPELLTPLAKAKAPEEPGDRKCVTYTFIIEATSDANRLGRPRPRADLKYSVITALIAALDEVPEAEFNIFVVIYDCMMYTFPLVNGQFMVNTVPEVEENFAPSAPGEVLVRVTPDNRELIKRYLEKILNFGTLKIAPNSCGNFALNCTIRTLAAGGAFGTVTAYYVTQPDMGLAACLEQFTDNKFTLTEAHKYFYDSLILMCYEHGICVDVCLCLTQQRISGDTTLQYIAQQTGGTLGYLPRFSHKFDYFKVYRDILRLLKVPAGYKCQLKLRTSRHMKVTEVICGFHNSRAVKDASTVNVPRIGPDLSIAFELSLNSLVDIHENMFIQCAVLYTSASGAPVVRVHTHLVRIISSLNEIFRNIHPEAMMNMIARRMVHTYIRTGKFDRKKVLNLMIEALSTYRTACANSTPKNQLILPDNIKLIPSYLNALLKYDVEAEFGMEFIVKMLNALNGSPKMTAFTAARAYCLHRSVFEPLQEPPEDGYAFTIVPIPSSASYLFSDGIYLLDDGYKLLVFVGPHVRPGLVRALFGPEFEFTHGVLNSVELVDTPSARNLMAAVDQVRSEHRGLPYAPLKILTYTAQNAHVIKLLLLEDATKTEPSYIDLLVTLHDKIREYIDKLF